MTTCHDLKEGDVLYCEDCGLELKVSKGCSCSDEGACSDQGFTCCGTDLKKK